MPSLSSSPRMRSAPQRGLRHAISRMSATRFVGGRADRRERRRQNARNPAQCQRRMVAGWMSRVASRQAGATRAARTIVKRCQGVQRTRPATFRSAAMSCCRRSAFSATSSMRRRTRSAASPETNRRRSITCRVLHRPRADGICSQDGLREVLGLRWSQVNLKEGVIKLSAEDTKTEEPRTVFLTSRVLEALEAQPRHIKSDWVFTNPETEEAWKDIRKAFRRACKAAKLTGVWFHDLRRSFVTNARRRGVPESVVMRMSGHRTRAVFDRYNIVEDDDLREAVKRIEAGRAISAPGSGQ